MLAALAAEIHGDEREAWHDICDEGYIHEFQHQFYEQFKYINSKSSRSTEFQDVLPLNISQVITKWISRCPPTEYLSGYHEDHSNQNEKSHTHYAMKQGTLFLVYWKVNGNWDKNMIGISQWRESCCRTNTSRRRNKSKRVGQWEPQSEIM